MRGCQMVGSVVLMFASFASARPPADEEPGWAWRVQRPSVQEATLGHLTFPAAFDLQVSALTLPAASRTARHTGGQAEVLRVTRGEVDVFSPGGAAPSVLRAGERYVVRPGSWCERANRTESEASVVVAVLVPADQPPVPLLP